MIGSCSKSYFLQKGQGAPGREPVINEEEQKKMMAYYYRKQEDMKVDFELFTLVNARNLQIGILSQK